MGPVTLFLEWDKRPTFDKDLTLLCYRIFIKFADN